MKFKSMNEMEKFSFEESEIKEFHVKENSLEWVLSGAVVKADNSQNGRFQDMFCGEIILSFENASMVKIIKEGMKYYDANGNLKQEVPDENVDCTKWNELYKNLKKGKIFTIVNSSFEEKKAYEMAVDLPKEEDEDEFDTFWLCFSYENVTAKWDRYCSPVEQS